MGESGFVIYEEGSYPTSGSHGLPGRQIWLLNSMSLKKLLEMNKK
jgi:hypothetical protein